MSMVVPLNVWELVAPVAPFIVRAAKLAAPKPAFSPPSLNAELLEMTLPAGDVAGVKSNVTVPTRMLVGPVYVFAPKSVNVPNPDLVNPPVPAPLLARTPP
jgi:hypothetical protein